MPPAFSSDIIARVKDETDIVEIVRQHVSLKQAGAVYKGLCPFHKEKTPSFIVTPARQRYHCFGCATGGDVISFLMEVEGITFPEAVEILARPLDIDLSSWLQDDESEGERRAFHRANEAAMGVWRDAFWDPRIGRGGLTYLTDRGFSEKVLRDFDVGWASGAGGWLESQLKSSGVDPDLALRADLLRRSERDGGTFAYFRNRIIFPVKNISRQVAGFGGRVVDQGEPKYLNSSDSTYFSKGKLLYGFDASRMPISREKCAILVEGYLDLLALVQAGIPNVVATCGTAFTEDQARLIRRGAPRVMLVFDGDKAGLKAAVRSADVALRCGLEPRIVRLPTGKDPADLVTEQGVEVVHETLRAAQGYIPLLKALADDRGGDREVTERALRQALTTAAGIGDPLRREYVLQEAAEVFGVGLELLRDSVEADLASRPLARKAARAESGRDRTAGLQSLRGQGAGAPGLADRGAGPDGPAGADGQDRQDHQVGPVGSGHGGGPRVRHNLARAQVGRIEAELLAHVLVDDSGEAARMFLAERGDLPLRSEGAQQLLTELEAWAEESKSGTRVTPRDFVLDRWNTVGDREYRGFVSQLISEEERPENIDYARVIKDCLDRLGQDHRSRRG